MSMKTFMPKQITVYQRLLAFLLPLFWEQPSKLWMFSFSSSSKSVEHPAAPKKSKNFRVEGYWSVMTVKPTKSWDEPGLEFSLTAFENPGVSLPASITTWVAIRGMPEFMTNLRKVKYWLTRHVLGTWRYRSVLTIQRLSFLICLGWSYRWPHFKLSDHPSLPP